jgi:hypothetical protein
MLAVPVCLCGCWSTTQRDDCLLFLYSQALKNAHTRTSILVLYEHLSTSFLPATITREVSRIRNSCFLRLTATDHNRSIAIDHDHRSHAVTFVMSVTQILQTLMTAVARSTGSTRVALRAHITQRVFIYILSREIDSQSCSHLQLYCVSERAFSCPR